MPDSTPRARTPPRISSPTPRQAARASTHRIAHCVISLQPPPLPLVLVAWLGVALSAGPARAADGDIGGAVADSATGTPLPGGEVRVTRDGSTVATATTDAFGRYVIHNLPAGSYSVEVRYLG